MALDPTRRASLNDTFAKQNNSEAYLTNKYKMHTGMFIDRLL